LYKGDKTHISIDGLRDGMVGMQFFACWISPKTRYHSSLKRGLNLIHTYDNMLKLHDEIFHPILSYRDIWDAHKQGRIGAMLTVEGGDILEAEISNLRILYKLGVRSLTLTWNYRNELADGVLEDKSNGGLSSFGYLVVQEMNHMGMLVDLSHISKKGFYDVLEVSRKPIAATHSNAYKVASHPRNLTDSQIRAVADNKGIIGVNFYPAFLTDGNKATVKDIISHIEHMAKIGGIDVIGFGSDFDGIENTPEGIVGPEGFKLIINDLLRLNYSEDDVKKIAHGNFKRVLKSVLK
ncbi:MAG TPA: dipeptidase, partial [Bacillota bacterium]|nr:dipeptidase [Bacillota bacterium]